MIETAEIVFFVKKQDNNCYFSNQSDCLISDNNHDTHDNFIKKLFNNFCSKCRHLLSSIFNLLTFHCYNDRSHIIYTLLTVKQQLIPL